MKVMSGHAVMVMNGSALVASRFGVPPDQILATLEELNASPEVVALIQKDVALSVLVDGKNMSEAPAPAPRSDPKAAPAQTRAPVRAPTDEGNLKAAELAHHMLWESYRRASQVQAFMLDKMTGAAVEMNQRFVNELEKMRGNYTKAMERIDGMEFEKRMLEHEAASRRLSSHYLRLAEEDNRAAERRREDNQSIAEQIARGVLRVVDAIGNDSINGKP